MSGGARFNGSDYVHPRDAQRLTDQLGRVFEFMRDGAWHSLEDISKATDDPPASVSAQLRHLRKPRFGSWIIEKKYEGGGLYHYRIAGRKNINMKQDSFL